MRGSIFRAQRPQQDVAAIELEMLLELPRIRANGQSLACPHGRWRDPDADIQRDHAFAIREQRVDIEIQDLRNIHRELRHLHQRVFERRTQKLSHASSGN